MIVGKEEFGYDFVFQPAASPVGTPASTNRGLKFGLVELLDLI